MEKVKLSLPQLTLVEKPGTHLKYLERFSNESEKPKVDLTFQEDSKQDPRIIAIKYQILNKDAENSIFYYSEMLNQYSIITFNLGFNYQGRVIALNLNNHKLGLNLEHYSKEGLRKRHLDKIDALEDIKKYLTPEHVAKRYRDFFYSLQKFI
ncbi:MAG TPA: hypothetical protein PK357_02780 [Candidatus Pacearchaeota archaeon]|nr:hypothetical protein [Candidatus Pacearchaeota archaeon]